MSSTGKHAAQAAPKNTVASAIAQFVEQNKGKTLTWDNPPPPMSGPTVMVIDSIETGKMVGLSPENGGGKGEWVLVKQAGAGEEAKAVKLNPNIVLALFRGAEVEGYKLGGEVHSSPFHTSATDGTVTTTETGEQANGDAPAGEGETGAAAAAPADDAKVKAAAAKKKAKEDAKLAREAERKLKAEKDELAKTERAQARAEKEKNSGKIAALRVFHSFDKADPERRKKVMNVFRTAKSEGGFGWSNQHANTYYQNCKSDWADYKLTDEDKAEIEKIKAARPKQ